MGLSCFGIAQIEGVVGGINLIFGYASDFCDTRLQGHGLHEGRLHTHFDKCVSVLEVLYTVVAGFQSLRDVGRWELDGGQTVICLCKVCGGGAGEVYVTAHPFVQVVGAHFRFAGAVEA